MRALQGSGWQKDAQQFQAYGAAIKKYAEAQMQGVSKGELPAKELSPLRLLLRGVLKQVGNLPQHVLMPEPA